MGSPAYPVALKIASLVAGGITLGAVMSMFISPVPKVPAMQTLPRPDQAKVTSQRDPYVWFEAGPEDVAFPRTAHEDEAIWQYPEPAYKPWEPEEFPPVESVEAPAGPAEEALDGASPAEIVSPSDPAGTGLY